MSQTNSPCESCANECQDRGCPAWRAWWVKKWNKEIYRKIQPEQETREVFQYEHPDREREMEAADGE